MSEEYKQLEEDLAEERAIVDRVWKALGITTYEQCKPFAIDEHVTRLRSQVEALTGQLERSQKAVLEWENREAKVCPENVSFESVIERLTKERDQAQAACAVQYEALLFVDDWDDKPGEPMIGKVLEKVRACFVPNPGQPLLGRLHALQAGAAEAVKALELIANQNCDLEHPSGCECCLSNSSVEGIAEDALATLRALTPLLTTPTKA